MSLPNTLRVLTYNMQAAIPTRCYRDYLSWRYVKAGSDHCHHLDTIASLLSSFDIVALQEVDQGSLRSGHVNQAKYLADKAQFMYWDQHVTRHFKHFIRQGNAVLSRYKPTMVQHHSLPGLIPGRGAMLLQFGQEPEALVVVIMHLALGPVARAKQLAYVHALVQRYRQVILMGDMNCSAKTLQGAWPHYKMTQSRVSTYPSWKPHRALDHVVVSKDLTITQARVVPWGSSDHLPLAVDIDLS